MHLSAESDDFEAGVGSRGSNIAEPEEESKEKVVWIVNHHAAVPSTGGYGRHLGLSRELRNHGWKTVLFLSSAARGDGKQHVRGMRRRKVSQEDGTTVVFVRSRAYRASLRERVVGMATFAGNLLLPGVARGIPKPDVIIGSTVHLLAAWSAMRLARRFGVPFVFEIRDLWPETLVDLGRLSERNVGAKILSLLSFRTAKHSDLVISPLPYVDQWLHSKNLGHKRFAWISNGSREHTPSMALRQSGANDGPFTVMYLGSHGNANELDVIIEAFDLAWRLRPDLALELRLVGDGPCKAKIQNRVSSLSCAPGVTFEERIPESEVLARASEADALIAALADLPVYRYGISLNKLFMYMNSGRPIIWASNAPNNPVRDAGAGICVPARDRESIAGAIIRMAEMPPAERVEMGRRGPIHVRERYSFQVLGKRLAEELDSLLAGGNRGAAS